MSLQDQIQQFSEQFGKTIHIAGVEWRYYRLGAGSPVFWLTGGLRRAALGFDFLRRLAERHTVISLDYPPVQTIEAFLQAFDAILGAEGVERFTLGGQSYGGLLAQAYLARRGAAVERLILSSTGPAVFNRGARAGVGLATALARLLPEKRVKAMLAGGLLKAIVLPEEQREEWQSVIRSVVENELSRADVLSHFAVPADLLKSKTVDWAALRAWRGRVVVFSASNDPTQNKIDFPRYEALFGRPVEVVSLGELGHAASLVDAEKFVALLEQVLD